MSYTTDDARSNAEALITASKSLSVRRDRSELRRRGNEWLRAASDIHEATEAGEEAVITTLAEVGPGMWAWLVGMRETTWLRVVRVLHQGGQHSLHLEGQDGRAQYRNFAGLSSPVVVRDE